MTSVDNIYIPQLFLHKYSNVLCEFKQQDLRWMPLQERLELVICKYQVNIILNSEGMIIRLFCPHRRRTFEVRLPYLLQGKSKQIQDIFINLDEFFQYLRAFSQDKNRISINDKGTIKIVFYVDRSKKINPPVVYIQTQILTAGLKLKNENKLHKDISQVKRQNLVLQNKINQLIKISQNNLKQIEELKGIVKKGDKKVYENSSDSSQGDQQMQDQHKRKKKHRHKKKYSVISGGGQSGLKQLGTTIQQLNKDIQYMKNKIETTQLQNNNKIYAKSNINPALIAQSQYLSEQQIFGKKMHITVDTNNPYLQSEYLVQGNRIEKINKYKRVQLLSREVIPPYGKHYFAMFIEKISYQIFSLGIVNQKRRAYQNSHQSKDLITYFAKTGAIWQYNPKGQMPFRSGGPKIPNGVQIRVVVDMNKYQIKWYMDRCEIASTRIQQHMRRERLVAYLEVNYTGNVVYWNQKTAEIE